MAAADHLRTQEQRYLILKYKLVQCMCAHVCTFWSRVKVYCVVVPYECVCGWLCFRSKQLHVRMWKRGTVGKQLHWNRQVLMMAATGKMNTQV
ncbi:hypothetical protein AOLI_G00099490 [Acnodon oligacanthus]